KIFRRENWQSLNGLWDFVYDDKREWNLPTDVTSWDLQIQVPFAPESLASGIANTDLHPRCWYRKNFSFISPLPPSQRLLLHFGAVDYHARVWLNGEFLGEHEGGYTPFSFDITDKVQTGSGILIIRVDDDPGDLTKPRGKQDWQR